MTKPLKQSYVKSGILNIRLCLYRFSPWWANTQWIPLYTAWSYNLYDTQCTVHTSSNWSPYSNPAWWAMLPPVTLETKIPPFSPLTIEIPSGSAPLCTMTLRGSSRYGLVGRRNAYRSIVSQKAVGGYHGSWDGVTVTALESFWKIYTTMTVVQMQTIIKRKKK